MAEMFSSPEGYERVMGRWSAILAPLFVEFAGVQKGGRVIDVGCGTGSMVQAISTWDSTARITGIDPVQAFIDYCESRFGDPRIAFRRGSALELPYPDGHFDHALSLPCVEICCKGRCHPEQKHEKGRGRDREP